MPFEVPPERLSVIRIALFIVLAALAIAIVVNPAGAARVGMKLLKVPSELLISALSRAMDPDLPRPTYSPQDGFTLSVSLLPLGPSGETQSMPTTYKAGEQVPEIHYQPNTSAAETVRNIAPITSTFDLPVRERGELPVRIEIVDAEVKASISNPDSTSLTVLDQALLKGAVRYPTTALLGVKGTMLIFGHSSYKPSIKNPAFRTFDGIQNLPPGAIIKIYSATAEYDYTVIDVKSVNAKDASENTIPLRADGSYLVIVTCNTFGSVDGRFVLRANFTGVRSLMK